LLILEQRPDFAHDISLHLQDMKKAILHKAPQLFDYSFLALRNNHITCTSFGCIIS